MSLENKNILITGGTSGIGKQAALFLAKKGANIILIGRNINKAKIVFEEINNLNPKNKGKFYYADLSLQSDIAKVFNEIKSDYKLINILINNAGAIFSERITTSEGLEKTFALNHMGYFSLTKLIIQIMDKNIYSRIINVASAAHLSGKIDFDDLFFVRRYGFGWKAYAQSKLANCLYANNLSRRLSGKGVTAISIHPGWVRSNLERFVARNIVAKISKKQLKEIAEKKMADLNAHDVDEAAKIIAGSARSMGIEVKD